MSEILTRSDGVIADINFKERIIDLIAIPWEETAQVFWRGEVWTETFERGAFNGIESRAGQVRVNREHRKGDTVGKIIEFNPSHSKGLFTRLKIVLGPKGDETLYLAQEDMISASIGYRANKGSDVLLDNEKKTRRVRNAVLDHLSMVEDPAFKGAQVLAVRGGFEVEAGPVPTTPMLDEMLRDPVIAWAMQRKAS